MPRAKPSVPTSPSSWRHATSRRPTASRRPARLREGRPVVPVHVRELSVAFRRVADDSLGPFLNDFYWQSRTYASQLEEMSEYTTSVYSGRFTVRATSVPPLSVKTPSSSY